METAKTAADVQACEALLFAEGYLYELLHKLFGGQPSAELLALAGSATTADVLEELEEGSDTLANLRAFAARVGAKACDPAYLEAVHEEFGRFFQGPAAPPAFPWEAPYLTHEPTVFQPSTLEVRAAYGAQGLQVRRFKRVPDDHIALMCAFMAVLSRRALDALRSGDREALRVLLADQHRFAEQHLASWLPEYASDALHVKEAVLYPQFIQGARAVVEQQLKATGPLLAFIDESDPASWAASCQGAAGALAKAEAVYQQLASLELTGLEDNELVAVDAAPESTLG